MEKPEHPQLMPNGWEWHTKLMEVKRDREKHFKTLCGGIFKQAPVWGSVENAALRAVAVIGWLNF